MRVFQILKFKILGAFSMVVDVYIISSDKTFVNKLSLEIASNTDHKIIIADTGEELIRSITSDEIKKKTLSLVVVDCQIVDRNSKMTFDGISTIKEIRKLFPQFEYALVYDEKNSSVVQRAAENNISTCVLKNKNVDIRILHFIYNHVNSFHVERDREFTKRFIIYIFLMIALFVMIIGINFLVN